MRNYIFYIFLLILLIGLIILIINYIKYTQPYFNVKKIDKITIDELKTGDLCLVSTRNNIVIKTFTASYFNHVGVIYVVPKKNRILGEPYVFVWDIMDKTVPRFVNINYMIYNDDIYIRKLNKKIHHSEFENAMNILYNTTMYSLSIHKEWFINYILKLSMLNKIKIFNLERKERICSQLVVDLYNLIGICDIEDCKTIFPKDLADNRKLKCFSEIKLLEYK